MEVVGYQSAVAFLADYRTALMENEAANSILLSYAENQVEGVESAMTTRFYSIVDDGKNLLPAMFTAEVWPLLGEGPDEAARVFARYLYATQPHTSGVTGPKDISLAFADEWERLTRCDLEIHHNTRLYECAAVADIKLPDGHSRQATLDDFGVVRQWRIGFRNDANTLLGARDSRIKSDIAQGRYFLWVTDRPVSMALYARETGNTGTIGAVYTPPEHRNHGYATAVTAATTRAILDSGKKFATLYTDLDNPTSNSIYQQIGYTPIMDSTLWRFIPAI